MSWDALPSLRVEAIKKEAELAALKADLSARPKDRDETRRLLYMALAARQTEKYSLVGTLVNALAHHGLGIHPAEAMTNLVAVVEDKEVIDDKPQWVWDMISRCTAELDEE